MAPRNDSFFRRLTQLFRSGPSIQRRVKGYDYKNYYDNELIRGNYGYRAPFPFGREASPFSVLGAYGILDRMARYSEFCFHPNTLIYTTKGAFTIKELAEKYDKGERFQIYSYDQNTKEITIADAHHPRITKNGEEQKLIKITFDDGGSISVTPDHKLMSREGWYEKAEELKVGDSLMPFHVKDTTGTGYKHIYTINKKGQNKYGWTPEHILVAENLVGRKLLLNETVHHIDFNPANNLPENLKVMPRLEHQNFHALLNNRNKFGKPNKKHSLWMRNNNPSKRNDITFDLIFDTANKLDFSMTKTMKALLVDQNVLKRRLREVGFSNWVDFKNNQGLLTTLRNAAAIIGEMTAPEISDIVEKCKNCRTISDASSILKCSDNSIRRRLEAHGYGTWTEFKNNSIDTKREKRKGILDEAISYQDICSIYQPGMTARAIAKKLNCTFNQVKTRIEREGYESFGAWKLSYKNHKIAKIEWLNEKSCVYNLTVDGHHNLAAGSMLPKPVLSKDGKSTSRIYSMVIVKQSEMEYTPEIAAALNIFADETVAGDEKGKAFHLFTRNPEVKRALEELFYDILNIDFNLRPWVRNLVKYGDFFLYNEVVPDIGVVTVQPIPVNELEREEGFDQNDPYAVRFKWLTRGNRYLENWQVTHMRMLGNDLFLPYGTCIAEGNQVLTPFGARPIEEIKRGEKILGYDLKTQKKITSTVLDVVASGKKECFKISTRHSFVEASKEHNILVKELDTERLLYKPVPELRSGKDCLVQSLDHKTNTKKYISKGVPNKQSFGRKNKFAWRNIDSVPNVMTQEFAQFLGFMYGDGWLQKNPSNRKIQKYDTVSFAMGIDERQNDKYSSLLEKYSGAKAKTRKVGATMSRSRTSQVHSTMLAEIFLRLDFQNGAHNKRLPSWLFSERNSIKSAFLKGFLDADSSLFVDKWNCSRYTIEVCNEPLLRDLKTLSQHVGWKSGKIGTRIRNNFGKEHTSHVLTLYRSQIKNEFEPIVSIEPCGVCSTYDIYVDDENHNFFANNVVVHNSLLEPARRTWRQLLMMEDAMLVYRVVRSPERRVFYIDVGNVAPNDVPSYMEAVKQTLRSNNVVDRTNGRVDQRYNPVSIDEDYFIPIRGNQTGTKIDTLAGGQNATATEDVEYLQRKLFAAIQVPKPYLNFDENLSAKASMAQMDIRFSRTIAVIQRIVVAELNKLAMIHLYTKGFDGEDLIDFELKLSNPSTIAIQQKLEVLSTKFDIAGKAKETLLCDEEWIQKQILDLSEDEIIKISAGRRRDKIRAVEIEAVAVQDNLPQKQTMTDPFDKSNYSIPGQAVDRNPAQVDNTSPGFAPPTASTGGGKLVSTGQGPLNGETTFKDTGSGLPIVSTPFLTGKDRNERRKVGWAGKGATSMPDFKAMLDAKRNRSLVDVYDKDTINLKNPLSISESIEEMDFKAPPVLPSEMVSIFNRLSIQLEKMARSRTGVLSENVDLSNIEDGSSVMNLSLDGDELILESVDDEDEKDDKEIDLPNID